MSELNGTNLKCPECGSIDIYPEEGHSTVFRCFRCNRIGNKRDFKDYEH